MRNNIRQEWNQAPKVVGIGLVDKQNGGSGMYARVELTIHPQERGDAPNQVINAVVGGAVPTAFIASVIEGVHAGLNCGPLRGSPVTGVVVTLTGGKAHSADSTTQAFHEAGRLAVQDALQKADVTILEPVAQLDVTTPAEFVGAVLGDINRRRGQVVEMDSLGDGTQTIRASVPLAETFGYATDLRSMTQGRAGFLLQPQGYAEVPAAIAQEITRPVALSRG